MLYQHYRNLPYYLKTLTYISRLCFCDDREVSLLPIFILMTMFTYSLETYCCRRLEGHVRYQGFCPKLWFLGLTVSNSGLGTKTILVRLVSIPI